MSHPAATITDMNLEIERLIAFKTAATTTRGQLDYVDLLALHAFELTARPGEIDRTAQALDELVAEIAARRTHEATGAPSAPEPAHAGTGGHIHPHEPSTGTGTHRAQEHA